MVNKRVANRCRCSSHCKTKRSPDVGHRSGKESVVEKIFGEEGEETVNVVCCRAAEGHIDVADCKRGETRAMAPKISKSFL